MDIINESDIDNKESNENKSVQTNSETIDDLSDLPNNQHTNVHLFSKKSLVYKYCKFSMYF